MFSHANCRGLSWQNCSVFSAILLTGFTCGSIAHADSYIGVGAGQSTFRDSPTSCGDLGLDPGCNFDVDDTDTGLRIFGGFRFNPNGALEVGYVDLGKAKINNVSGTVGGTPVSGSGEFKATGVDVSLLGLLPFGQGFGAMARIGFMGWDAKASATASSFGTSASVSDSATGTDLTYGLGLTFDFSNTVGGRLEWQRFKNVGDQNTTGQTDIDLLSFSALFKF
jgi:OOP family OmpA-OmpF porin